MAKKGNTEKPSLLQAVIIADNFDKKISPLLVNKIWSNCTLANYPLIDYTLEWLSRTEVNDIIVVVTQSNTHIIQPLLKQWTSRFYNLELVQCRNCMSFGDAVREVDSRSLISGDFLLLSVGTFCSNTLETQINAYRTRRNQDKNNVMTLIFTEMHRDNTENRQIIGVEDGSGKLTIYHKEMDGQKLNVIKSFFLSNTRIRRDLLDTGIAICSPKICPQFSDNFDFRQRDDVIREILINEEILCQNINIDVLPPRSFAFAIKDFGSFLAASNYVLRRWAYPLVPDCLASSSDIKYIRRTDNVYTPADQTVHLNKNATVGPNAILGPKCQLEIKTSVSNSSLADGCSIGDNTSIVDSILDSNICTESNCHISSSIICADVHLGANCSIGDRCIIGPNVHLPHNTTLRPGTVICASRPKSDEESIVGIEFDGNFEWIIKDCQWWPELNKETISDLIEETTGVSWDSTDNISIDEDRTDGPTGLLNDGMARFYEEILDSLQRGVEESTTIKNLVLEINSSKFAYNVPMEDVARLLMKAILAIGYNSATDSPSLLSALKSLFARWKSLLTNYYQPKLSQIQALIAIEEDLLCHDELLGPCVQKLLHGLYNDDDILSEEAILEWFQHIQGPTTIHVKHRVETFVNWLRDAEEESD